MTGVQTCALPISSAQEISEVKELVGLAIDMTSWLSVVRKPESVSAYIKRKKLVYPSKSKIVKRMIAEIKLQGYEALSTPISVIQLALDRATEN